MTAVAFWVGEESASLVFEGIIRLDTVRFIFANDMRGVFVHQTFKFDAGRF